MGEMIPPSWLVYPGARVQLALSDQEGKLVLHVIGNPQGLASLTGTFLWLQSFSDHGAISVSGLPFVKPEGALALSVVLTMDESRYQGRLVRLDRDRQFEWQIGDERLLGVAVQVHRLAISPDYIDNLEARVSPHSDALLRFEAKGSEDHA